MKKNFLKLFLLFVMVGTISFFVSLHYTVQQKKIQIIKSEYHPVDEVKDNTDPPEIINVVKLNASSTFASIEYQNPPKKISAWKNALEEEIVINAAYFLEDFTPAGFLVVDKKKVGAMLFDQDKSGLIVIDQGKLSIRDLNSDPIKKNEQFEFALQSYPFLIKNSQKAIKQDSGKKAFRTAVGVDAEQNVYVLSVLSHQISLYEFMNEITKLNIPFTYVLNLDGGPSSGLFVHWGSQQFFSDSMTAVSSILRFRKI